MEVLKNHYLQLYELALQGRLKELENCISAFNHDDQTILKALYIYNYGLAEFSCLDQSYELCLKVIENYSSDSPFYFVFDVKLQLYLFVMDPFTNISRIKDILEKQLKYKNKSTFDRAVIYESLSKITMTSINTGKLNALKKSEAISYQKNAITDYYKSNANFEYIKASILLASLYTQSPFKNLDTAKTILNTVIAENEIKELLIFTAHAKLLLIEIKFIELHSGEVNKNTLQQTLSSFADLKHLYNKNGHVLGSTMVNDKLGSLLLKFGYETGLSILKKAIITYSQFGFTQRTNVLWQNIGSWHILKGDNSARLKAEENIDASKSKTTERILQFNKALKEMETAGRRGNLEASRVIYAKAKQNYGHDILFYQFTAIRANQLGQAGQKSKAEELLRNVVNELKHLEISKILSEAYYNLAAKLERTNPQETLQLLDKALYIQDQLDDAIGSMPIILLKVSTLIYQQQKKNISADIAPLLEFSLDEGLKRIQKNFSIYGIREKGKWLQSIGLLYFQYGELDRCFKYLDSALELFEKHQLHSELGFLQSHKALCLIQLARKTREIQHYEKAITLFVKSKSLAKKLEFNEQIWRTTYFQGICHFEIGQNTNPNNDNLSHWENAEIQFDSAYEIISIERAQLDASSQMNREKAILAFIQKYIKLCMQAFRMNLFWAKNNTKALKWLERMKAQSLLDIFQNKDYSISQTHLLATGMQNDKNLYERVTKMLS